MTQEVRNQKTLPRDGHSTPICGRIKWSPSPDKAFDASPMTVARMDGQAIPEAVSTSTPWRKILQL